jgi:predicted metal-dependent hydrolase
MTETLHIADLDFEVRRGPRRKTLGLTVDRAGELVVHAPAQASESELRRWVTRKMLWVHQKLAQKQELNANARTPEFVTGESFFYLGKGLRLRLVETGQRPLLLSGEWLLLRRRDHADAGQHFRRWYLDKGGPWLSKRVVMWQPRLNVEPLRVRVSDLGFRWGSCGKRGALNFNWRLLQFPVRLIDYVIVHELAHLLEHKHTFRFWQVLDRALPDWRERKSAMESSWQEFAVFGIEVRAANRRVAFKADTAGLP